MKIDMWLLLSSTACSLAFTLGCGGGPVTDYSSLGLVEASGTVTLDGEAVEGAAVYFYASDETYCFGVTDASGRYNCMLNSEKSGITPGRKRVEISTTSNPLGDAAEVFSSEEDEEDPDAKRKKDPDEKIPNCYNTNSKLQVTISESDSGLDFDLKSDCSTTSSN